MFTMLSIQSAPIGCWRWVMNNFMNLFRFDSTKALHIGVEQECFLADVNGVIRPLAAHVLSQLPKREQSTPYPQYGYELSACQLESKIGPCTLNLASKHLWCVEEELRRQEKSRGCMSRDRYACSYWYAESSSGSTDLQSCN